MPITGTKITTFNIAQFWKKSAIPALEMSLPVGRQNYFFPAQTITLTEELRNSRRKNMKTQ
ncbi:hypothetical protein CWATWH0003_B204 [Crocosphaera watsonii WH 0003]|uniref:Uncharacterized protein n=2 Tax=Crocosphaera watsonii TaxID=263511 RepID=G5JEL7_CROWT|nr:hypothetical protein CWATWH0003_B204 [Crocosphaera watsonii WH 0003]CCQ54056.1 hypothetical protein CWATWH0005_3419 [Crocosphaera watsonii WH 0005]